MMEIAENFWEQLFSSSADFSEADYLAFLSRRVPKDIASQLSRDADPELGLSESVDIEYLIRPLTTGRFPDDNLFEAAHILQEHLIRYGLDFPGPPVDDPYKLIFSVSLYLHCFLRLRGTSVIGPYLTSLDILATICPRLDLETRLQVCRFLGSLLPTIHTEIAQEPAATTSAALIVLAAVLASILNDLSVTAQHVMKEERIKWTWSEANDELSGPARERISALTDVALKTFGDTGSLQQSANRFLKAMESE